MHRISSILLIVFIFQPIFAGCAQAERIPNQPPIKGKFLLSSTREGATIKGLEHAKTYILENGKFRKIAGDLGYPKWSADGKNILASDPNKPLIYVMDDKGTVLKEISTDGFVPKSQWFPDQKKVLYVTKKYLDIDNHKDPVHKIFVYDMESEETTLLHTFQANQYLMDLRLSHDGSKFAFYVNDFLHKKVPRQLGVYDLSTGEIKTFPSMFVLGWMPDDIHVVVRGNMKDDGTKFDNLFGIVGTINTQTGELKILRHETKFYLEESLSKDGKYLVYVRSVGKNTQCVFVNELATDKETQVTFPEPIGNAGQYSSDAYADWFQG